MPPMRLSSAARPFFRKGQVASDPHGCRSRRMLSLGGCRCVASTNRARSAARHGCGTSLADVVPYLAVAVAAVRSNPRTLALVISTPVVFGVPVSTRRGVPWQTHIASCSPRSQHACHPPILGDDVPRRTAFIEPCAPRCCSHFSPFRLGRRVTSTVLRADGTTALALWTRQNSLPFTCVVVGLFILLAACYLSLRCCVLCLLVTAGLSLLSLLSLLLSFVCVCV